MVVVVRHSICEIFLPPILTCENTPTVQFWINAGGPKRGRGGGGGAAFNLGEQWSQTGARGTREGLSQGLSTLYTPQKFLLLDRKCGEIIQVVVNWAWGDEGGIIARGLSPEEILLDV